MARPPSAPVVDLDLASQTLILQTDAGARRRINSDYAAGHVNHAYALTGHAAQGATVDRAFVLLSDEGALREWGYVACSRARTETSLYIVTDAHEREKHGRDLEPGHASVRIARALTASSSEQLALESAAVAPSSDPSLRALAQRRGQLERARLRAGERLSEAETKLEHLGWRGRRRQGPELRAEIGFQRTALTAAAAQLADIETRLDAQATARPSDRPLDLARLRRQVLIRSAPEREPVGLDLGL